MCRHPDPLPLGHRPREFHLLALQLFKAYLEDPCLLAHRLLPGVPLLLGPLLVSRASLHQAPLLVPGVPLLLDPLLVPGPSLLLTTLLMFGASPLLPLSMPQLLTQPCTATWLLEQVIHKVSPCSQPMLPL